MLTRFQLDAYLTTQAMLISWGPSYQTELDHVSQIITSEVTEAHSEALSEDLWRCDSDGNVLPVAAAYRRRASQKAVADAWSTGSTFALMDALRTAQPVSLIKSDPATYCSGFGGLRSTGLLNYIGRINSLSVLHLAHRAASL